MRQRLNYLHILNAFSLASALPLTVYSLLPAASLLLGLPLYNYPTVNSEPSILDSVQLDMFVACTGNEWD
jgi:hypothetical protein